MTPTQCRGQARHLIGTTRQLDDLTAALRSGLMHKVERQFLMCGRSKKSEPALQKMQRAAGTMMRARILEWTRPRAMILLESMCAAHDIPVYDFHIPGRELYREPGLLLFSMLCRRNGRQGDFVRRLGPSMGLHAMTRLLERGAATPTTLKATCFRALCHVRDATALLPQGERPFDLLIPFAQGALVAITHGFETETARSYGMPMLSIRTYLPEEMLNDQAADRILDLENFYLKGDFSDVATYRRLLEQNRRYRDAEFASETRRGDVADHCTPKKASCERDSGALPSGPRMSERGHDTARVPESNLT